MFDSHLDKRTVAARAEEELAQLEGTDLLGVQGISVRVRIARFKAGISVMDLAHMMVRWVSSGTRSASGK